MRRCFSIATPYAVPTKQSKKVRNIGDGFILAAILDFLKPHECAHVLSSRIKPSDTDIENINSTSALILAGANQLDDTFTIFPGMSLAELQKIRVPIVPFGVGINGHHLKNTVLSSPAREALSFLHERLRFSSWRCSLTVDYLNRHCPRFSDRYLETGCPTLYGPKLLTKDTFSDRRARVVVTVTDKGDFEQREKAMLDFVRRHFPSSQRFLSLHQDFESESSAMLRQYARKQGFRVFVPRTVVESRLFYDACDLHVGSRLHAHLYFLSQAKKSFLVPVDRRAEGFAQSLGFALHDFRRPGETLEGDFELYRVKAIRHHAILERFVSYLKEDLLSG